MTTTKTPEVLKQLLRSQTFAQLREIGFLAHRFFLF